MEIWNSDQQQSGTTTVEYKIDLCSRFATVFMGFLKVSWVFFLGVLVLLANVARTYEVFYFSVDVWPVDT